MFYLLFCQFLSRLVLLFHPTSKVPYELLNKKYRAALKGIDLKVSHVKSAALELEKGLSADTVRAGDISRLLGGVAEHLSVMKRKVQYKLCMLQLNFLIICLYFHVYAKVEFSNLLHFLSF